MSAEWVTAVATILTAIVIAASALAALLQIRHLRTGNQISAFNEHREMMDSPEFREALHFIRNELPARLDDRAMLAELTEHGFRGEYAGIRLVANAFESMGMFVRTGMLDRRIAVELWAKIVHDTWNVLRPLTASVRKRYASGIWVNFEYMAMLSEDGLEASRENDGYPRGARRMPL